MTAAAIRAAGKPFPHGDERAFLLLPAGARGPAFLMLPNFRVLVPDGFASSAVLDRLRRP